MAVSGVLTSSYTSAIKALPSRALPHDNNNKGTSQSAPHRNVTQIQMMNPLAKLPEQPFEGARAQHQAFVVRYSESKAIMAYEHNQDFVDKDHYQELLGVDVYA